MCLRVTRANRAFVSADGARQRIAERGSTFAAPAVSIPATAAAPTTASPPGPTMPAGSAVADRAGNGPGSPTTKAVDAAKRRA